MSVQQRIALSLSAVRAHLGLTLEQVSAGTDLPVRSIRHVERGDRARCQLSQVHALCTLYRLPLLWVVGSDTWAPDPAGWVAPPWDLPGDFAGLAAEVRYRVRARRHQLGVGTKSLAARAGVHQPWIVRIESGEVQTLDLVRLELLTQALELPLGALLKKPERKVSDEEAGRRTDKTNTTRMA